MPVLSGTGVAFWMFPAMLVLVAMRVPIAVAMFIPGAAGFLALTDELVLLNMLKGSAVARLTVYDLSVIPLFLLMGQFATQGGLSRELFKAAAAFVGHIKGGLGMAAIVAAASFGSVCGSSVATTATICQVAYPEMERHRYSGRFSTGLLATGGSLGIMIPPSVPLIVYAILTEQNIAKLFAAAVVPGIAAALGYIAVIAISCYFFPDLAVKSERLPWSERFKALIGVLPIALIFFVVFGGIYTGIFTPTEGAGVGALGTFVGGFVKRELDTQAVKRCLLGTAETSAMVFMIFLGADMMNSALALTYLPTNLADWVTHLDIPPLAIIAAIIIGFILLCCVMDELALLMLMVPVFFPAVMGLDLWGLGSEEKAIWFGILILMVMQIGLIMPPVGMNVFVVNGMCRSVPMNETYKGVMPFLVSDVSRLGVLLFFPVVSLWLTRLFFS